MFSGVSICTFSNGQTNTGGQLQAREADLLAHFENQATRGHENAQRPSEDERTGRGKDSELSSTVLENG